MFENTFSAVLSTLLIFLSTLLIFLLGFALGYFNEPVEAQRKRQVQFLLPHVPDSVKIQFYQEFQ